MEEILSKLEEMLARIERIDALLESSKTILDLDEAARYLSLSKGYIYRLTSTRKIPHFKNQRKLYFDKTELDAWAKEIKIPTDTEVESKAALYTITNHKK